jgi:hypothetical protein
LLIIPFYHGYKRERRNLNLEKYAIHDMIGVMISPDNQSRLDGRVAIDLSNFDSTYLSSAGELGISPRFENNILLQIGDDNLLEVSRVTLDDNAPEAGDDNAHNLYTIRNLQQIDAPLVMLSDERKPADRLYVPGESELTLFARQELIIGTAEDATPGLALSAFADPHHVRLRLGNMSGRLHFSNVSAIGSLARSIVHLDGGDIRYLERPMRHFSSGSITHEVLNGRWTRPGDDQGDLL